MVELTPGSGVYLFPGQVQRALFVGEEAGKPGRNGEKMARYLLTQFYSAKELIGKTLASNNPNREQVNPFIVEAITSKYDVGASRYPVIYTCTPISMDTVYTTGYHEDKPIYCMTSSQNSLFHNKAT